MGALFVTRRRRGLPQQKRAAAVAAAAAPTPAEQSLQSVPISQEDEKKAGSGAAPGPPSKQLSPPKLAVSHVLVQIPFRGGHVPHDAGQLAHASG